MVHCVERTYNNYCLIKETNRGSGKSCRENHT